MSQTVAAPAHPLDLDSPDDRRSPSGSRWARRRGLILQLAMIVAILVSLIAFRDQLPDFGAIWSAATHADPGWLALVILAEAASMGAFARLQRRLLRVGGLRITLRRAFAITYAGNALSTTLPAGPAVSVVYTFRQFRRSGAPARLATAVIIAGGVITTTAYTVIGLLALLVEPSSRGPALTTLAIPTALLAVLAPALWHQRSRARLAAPFRRPARAIMSHRRIAPYAAWLVEARDVLRPSRRDWGALVVLSVLNWVFDILALFAAARAVGIEVQPHAVTLAYFAAQAAGSLLPLLPGGIGAIESSMAASLVAFGATLAPASAAVGLYRLVSYWAVVAVGWIAWFALQEGPRLSERTRQRLASVGQATMAGFGSLACSTPYAMQSSVLPAAGEPQHP
jgi:uncharacterized protein (TIRG00374 family)